MSSPPPPTTFTQRSLEASCSLFHYPGPSRAQLVCRNSRLFRYKVQTVPETLCSSYYMLNESLENNITTREAQLNCGQLWDISYSTPIGDNAAPVTLTPRVPRAQLAREWHHWRGNITSASSLVFMSRMTNKRVLGHLVCARRVPLELCNGQRLRDQTSASESRPLALC